jgi:hypothetical protein
MAGRSASKTRVNALTTRASIGKSISLKGMDCRVKPGNDVDGSVPMAVGMKRVRGDTARRARQTPRAQASKGRRHEIVDDREHDQKDKPGSEAKADELLLDRQQRLGGGPLKFGADIGL